MYMSSRRAVSNQRDPRVDPKPGDVLSVGGSQRQVDGVGCRFGTGEIQVGWVRSCGDSGSMSLKSWKRWAAKAEVIRAAE